MHLSHYQCHPNHHHHRQNVHRIRPRYSTQLWRMVSMLQEGYRAMVMVSHEGNATTHFSQAEGYRIEPISCL